MITLSATTNGVEFTFTDSKYYLYGDGTIEVPLNSLSLVLDNSGAATFKKAASNDVFVSAPLSEFGMTKADIEEFYENNMVGGGVDPEEVVDIVESATTYYDGVEYDSVNSRINFKHNNVVEAYVDAAPFIVDGMVDNVAISGGNLVITFNTDSGKSPISIPLTDIFDPNNYYNKTAINTIISGVNDSIIEDEEVISSALNDLNERKLDASAYTPTDLSNYYTKSETSGATEIQNALNNKLTDVSTGSASYAGSGVTDIKISKNGSSYTTRTFVASINNKPILAGSDYTNVNKFSLVETSAITSSVTSASTDTEIPSAKAVYDALGQGGGGSYSAGTNISIVNDTINCTLPITIPDDAGLVAGNDNVCRDGSSSLIFGYDNRLNTDSSLAHNTILGKKNSLSSTLIQEQFIAGNRNILNGVGVSNNIYGEGFNLSANTRNCTYIGKYGKSAGQNNTFVIGDGYLDGNLRKHYHNAVEIINGDIYIVDTNDTSTSDYYEKPMIKLQDHLGGGSASSAITSGDTNAVQGGVLYDKFDEVEQVTAAALNNLNNKFGGLSLVKLTQAEYDALTTKDNNILYVIVD